MTRCGIHRNHPCFEGAHQATMAEWTEWVGESDQVITF